MCFKSKNHKMLSWVEFWWTNDWQRIHSGVKVLEQEEGGDDDEDQEERVVVEDGEGGGLVVSDLVLLPQDSGDTRDNQTSFTIVKHTGWITFFFFKKIHVTCVTSHLSPSVTSCGCLLQKASWLPLWKQHPPVSERLWRIKRGNAHKLN